MAPPNIWQIYVPDQIINLALVHAFENTTLFNYISTKLVPSTLQTNKGGLFVQINRKTELMTDN